jgi:hypothetical protein
LRASAALVALTVACGGPSEPGPIPVALHRLNRSEYDRTVRDLLGTARTPARDFPADEFGHGFDNIADVLSLSSLQLELYDAAARDLARELVGSPPIERIEGVALSGPSGAAFHGRGWRLAEGAVNLPFLPSRPGTFRIELSLSPIDLGGERPIVALMIADRELVRATVGGDRTRVAVELTVSSTETPERLWSTISNPHRESKEAQSFIIEWIRIEGPLEDGPPGARQKEILPCRPSATESFESCARRIVERFMQRSYRRTIRDAELERMMRVALSAWDEGERFEDAVALTLRAILVSPHFLFRSEPQANRRGALLDDHALASRLSYFLWSSMPDDRLFELAAKKRLQDEATIASEVERMLADPKADALFENFAGQWLHLRGLASLAPDAAAFPEWDQELRESLGEEMELFFGALLEKDRTVEDLLLADFTFIDERLASHYALAESGRLVLAPDNPRRGILGKGAILALTSHPSRTSPVRRGKWVLTELLCSAPPPPPPNVAELAKEEASQGSLRQRMERHRRDPACAGCHATMDPIGFGLESFDGIGRWRELDEGAPIDASGELFGGSFDGPVELSRIIAARPELRRCVAQKVLTYALGRGVTSDDEADLSKIAARPGLREIIIAAATSEAFRSRRVAR